MGPSTPVKLPAAGGYSELKTGGDYAATMGCAVKPTPEGALPCFLAVVKLSTGRLWVLPPRPASNFVRVLAVTPEEIVAGEHDPTIGFSTLDRILRLRTANLDAFEKAW